MQVEGKMRWTVLIGDYQITMILLVMVDVPGFWKYTESFYSVSGDANSLKEW